MDNMLILPLVIMLWCLAAIAIGGTIYAIALILYAVYDEVVKKVLKR
jgi:hypothetical protein